MSALYWIAGAVLLVLLTLAFRGKRVAFRVEEFAELYRVEEFVCEMDFYGYDSFIERVSNQPLRWQVSCYRRKEQES